MRRLFASVTALVTVGATACFGFGIASADEINQALVHLTRMNISLHESIKSLETTALAHDAQIEELIKNHKSLQRQWQAYLNPRPRT